MNGSVLKKEDITSLENEALNTAGNLVIKPYSFWQEIDQNKQSLFMLKYGIYVLPTFELIEWLKSKIIGVAIEIGAGNGSIARELKIPITDSRMQEREDIKLMYFMGGQPVIKYPEDVEKLDSFEAIYKYRPQTVIGAFITHKYIDEIKKGNFWGVDEDFILLHAKRYLNIGNLETHKHKPILQLKHEAHYFPWLITRSINQSANRIFEFNNGKF